MKLYDDATTTLNYMKLSWVAFQDTQGRDLDDVTVNLVDAGVCVTSNINSFLDNYLGTMYSKVYEQVPTLFTSQR